MKLLQNMLNLLYSHGHGHGRCFLVSSISRVILVAGASLFVLPSYQAL